MRPKNPIIIITGKQEIGKTHLANEIAKSYPNIAFITSNVDISNIDLDCINCDVVIFHMTEENKDKIGEQIINRLKI